MRNVFFLILGTLLLATVTHIHGQTAHSETFAQYFAGQTMRLDYIHSGDASAENFELIGAKAEGVWAGKTYHPIDPFQRGLYFFEVFDATTQRLLFSQGFCSVFGEWQTTPEAHKGVQPFNESIRIPWPKAKVNVVMSKRDTKNTLQPIWSFEVDPATIKTLPATATDRVVDLLVNGDPKEKVDIVVVGDGYTVSEMETFRKDASLFMEYFFAVEPFQSRRADFNVRAVEVVSEKSGIANPLQNFYPKNALATSYNSLGVDRYVISNNDWAVRDHAAAAPYDFIVILLNSAKYGGGGIYNLYITAAARGAQNDYVYVHEMGHHMAGLADEYYQSHVSYQPADTSVEPWEANVTALLNVDSLKWGDLVKPGTPIPTPWNKKEYETTKANPLAVLKNDPHAHLVGAFEGANYLSNNMYRSELNCIMFSQSLRFCRVCDRELQRVIDSYCK